MISERIKSETAVFHQQVEDSPLMKPISEKSITKDQYISILSVFYGYFSGIEQQLDRIKELQDFLPDYSSRRKSERIADDLRQLGANPISSNNIPLPEIKTVSDAFGALYVMEGSTLGGRFISGVIKDQLGIDVQSGVSFFNGYGPETGSKWNAFKDAMNAYSNSDERSEAVINAANNTFKNFYEWIMKAR